MADSILNSVKRMVGVAEDLTVYDGPIISFINTSFSNLNDLGIGPEDGFMIEDASVMWDAFIGNDPRLNRVKTYVYLNVRLLLDPPSTSFHTEALKEQVQELGWRLNAKREEDTWVPPST